MKTPMNEPITMFKKQFNFLSIAVPPSKISIYYLIFTFKLYHKTHERFHRKFGLYENNSNRFLSGLSFSIVSQFHFYNYKIALNLFNVLINKFNRLRPMRTPSMRAGGKAGRARDFLLEKNSTEKRRMWKTRIPTSFITFHKNARSCCTICPNKVWHTCQLMKKIQSGRIITEVLFLLTINNPSYFA